MPIHIHFLQSTNILLLSAKPSLNFYFLQEQQADHSRQIAVLSNDVEKIQLVEEREEICKEGDEKSQVAAVDEGEKDVTKLSVEKGKSKTKKGKFFERVNRLLF